MIKLLNEGKYKLIETKHSTKVLYLDKEVYAWVEPTNIGEILVFSHTEHKTDCVLSIGKYRLYQVKNEPNLSDHIHLELEVGVNEWQGYFLLTGLPSSKHKRGRIIPTKEIISKRLAFR